MTQPTLIKGNYGTISTYGDSPDVVKSGPAWDSPTHIMFLYVRFNNNQTLQVAHYFDEMGNATLSQKLDALLENARPHSGAKNPPIQGNNFRGFDFGGFTSWFVIFLDEGDMDFWPAENGQIEPIIFLSGKDIADASGHIAPVSYDPNFTYYNLERIKIGGRPALKMINYITKDSAGTPLGEGETLHHGFNLSVGMKFNFDDGGETVLPVIFDPDPVTGGPKK